MRSESQLIALARHAAGMRTVAVGVKATVQRPDLALSAASTLVMSVASISPTRSSWMILVSTIDTGGPDI